MIEFLGSSPTGSKEYICSVCKTEFELRHEDYEDPKFCPFCGNPEDEKISVEVKAQE